ncbi:glycosyltransferase [Lachnospiraceae bacterium]|nr:glycosyltransferase [Lachnospiraceae bacterium]
MQNIALIIDTLQGGGAERCAADLSRIFADRGFHVFIFTDLSISIGYEYKGTLVNFKVSMSDGKEWGNPIRYKVNELGKLKDRYHIDIAVSFMQGANYLNILSKRKDKVILTIHGVTSLYAKQEKSVIWAEETFRELYQYADVIMLPSDFCRRDWLEHYGDKNNITRTMYNPVHRMEIGENRDKGNVVITVGRMHGDKRQWHLIKAFSLVKKMCPDSKLIILGDGELRAEQENMIKRFGLENDVELPGNVKNVGDYLAKAKVFAMTSRCEAMSCSVLEALSAGVPVVACDCPGGMREELGISYETKNSPYPLIGECGIITPYMEENGFENISPEEEAFAEEMVRLLKDDGLRTRMAAAAGTMLQKFLPDAIGEAWVEDIFVNNLKREIDRESFENVRDKSIGGYERLYVSYYRLLEKWMVLHERGGSVKQYFVSRDMKNVILYGLGKMANHFIEDIKGSGINIICGIDKMDIDRQSGFPVIRPDEGIPHADCIIITPVHEAENIKQKLELHTQVPLISLSDILDDCLQENGNS